MFFCFGVASFWFGLRWGLSGGVYVVFVIGLVWVVC